MLNHFFLLSSQLFLCLSQFPVKFLFSFFRLLHIRKIRYNCLIFPVCTIIIQTKLAVTLLPTVHIVIKTMGTDNVQRHYPWVVHIFRFWYNHDEVLLSITINLNHVIASNCNIQTSLICIHAWIFDLAAAVNGINCGMFTAAVNKQSIFINNEVCTSYITFEHNLRVRIA